MDKVIKSKAPAKAAIVGKWEWVETTYSSRGAEKVTENPLTTNKTVVYEFERDTLSVYENDTLAEKLAYEIRHWGEGTNTVDEQLVIILRRAKTGEHLGTSIMFLSTASTCLRLVNSYDDAGGDMLFKRAD